MTRVVIDVREPDEFAAGHVKGALNITAADLLASSHQLDNIPKDSEIIVYCRSGNRSMAAIDILKNMGFQKLTNGINQTQVESKYGL